MKLAIIVVGILVLALRTQAQTAEPSKEPAKASLVGSVVKDPSGEPVKKAIIEMIAENQGEGGNYTAMSDADGHFKITDILPGRYRLLVERTGYIEVDKKGRRSPGSMLSVGAGQEIKGHTLHMLAAAILTGRVLDEDGDPMANVDVTVLRRTGKSYEPNGSAQTNDLGEYRIGGLLVGKYYVAATPLPNFQAIAMMGKAAQGHDAAAPRTSYLRTFYPGVLDRTQASTIDLHGGEETPVDFALARKHAASVRGRVSGLTPGAGGMVMLRSKEANSEFHTGEIDKDGKFEILNVAPGSYMLTAIAVLTDKPQIVREPLEVGTADIEDVQLAPQPPANVRGRVHFSGKSPELAASAGIFLHSLDGDDFFENGVTMSGDETAGSPSFAKLKTRWQLRVKECAAREVRTYCDRRFPRTTGHFRRVGSSRHKGFRRYRVEHKRGKRATGCGCQWGRGPRRRSRHNGEKRTCAWIGGHRRPRSALSQAGLPLCARGNGSEWPFLHARVTAWSVHHLRLGQSGRRRVSRRGFSEILRRTRHGHQNRKVQPPERGVEAHSRRSGTTLKSRRDIEAIGSGSTLRVK
jgi:Carboxypeptidase regulatory-like domain